VLIADCIKKGRDYYSVGPRYNTDYIQCTGIGTVTDSLSAIKKHAFEGKRVSLKCLIDACNRDWEGDEALRLTMWNKTPFYGNDDDYADSTMRRVYESLFAAIDGKRAYSAPTTT
jgi:formate C-acetyltransferase